MVKVLQDTPDATVIEDRPWVLGLCLIVAMIGSLGLLIPAWRDGDPLLGAVALVLAGGSWAAFRLAIRRSRLTLGADGTAQLSVHARNGWTHRNFAPGTLRAAIETNRSGDGDTTRPVLLIDSADGVERIPLTAYFATSATHDEAVARINAWAGRPAAPPA
ncbi:MAG: hypothetical protein AAFY77_10095 [Pseudomonadota bacterium]